MDQRSILWTATFVFIALIIGIIIGSMQIPVEQSTSTHDTVSTNSSNLERKVDDLEEKQDETIESLLNDYR